MTDIIVSELVETFIINPITETITFNGNESFTLTEVVEVLVITTNDTFLTITKFIELFNVEPVEEVLVRYWIS